MPRSDPARSKYCATRHLLRYLGNPRELRRNPLASEAFARMDAPSAALAVRRRALDAIAALQNQRCVAILLRVDVENHRPAHVARDLGLSERQYHRERRRAHELFLEAFVAFARPQLAVVDDGFAQRALRHAASLADSGETASARAILCDAIGSRSTDAAFASDAAIRLATIDLWMHRYAAAAQWLRCANSRIAGMGDASARGRLRDAHDAASCMLHAFADGPETVRRHDPPGYRTAIACADAAFFSGDSARARTLLQTFGSQAADDEAFGVDLLLMQAELANFTVPRSTLGEELFKLAIERAAAAGLRGRALYGEHHLHVTRWMRSRNPRDRAAYRALVDSVNAALPRRLRMYLASSAADIELAIGSARRALRCAQTARSLSNSKYECLSADALAASAQFKLQNLPEARELAAATADAARSAGYPRIVALAQRINAQTLHAFGRRRDAREAIEESLECARHSSAYVAVQTRLLRDRITGARRDRRRRRTEPPIQSSPT